MGYNKYMTSEELLKTADLQKIANEGAKIYSEVQSQYEPAHKGEFLAIDIDTKDVYLAPTRAEAMVAASAAHPDKVFYVMKIGFDAAETMAHFSTSR
jgi:hypothetical protein